MKYTDLIKGQWYQGTTGDIWIFRFDKLDGVRCWNTKAGHLRDSYKDMSHGYLSNLKDIKVADMEEVFRLFPEERELFKNQQYEIY